MFERKESGWAASRIDRSVEVFFRIKLASHLGPKTFFNKLLELLVTGRGQFRAEVISIVRPRLRLLRGKERLSRNAAISVTPNSLLVIRPIEPARHVEGSGLVQGDNDCDSG
jgi:hypothetical protein